ncbi:MAG TPA: RHS repeat-associated core domain-containing protein [Pyrinomonadaceae bacterium]|nr:RHS repeat-associated core domain-containing protein [Pyrinomonadaceae bacterium]
MSEQPGAPAGSYPLSGFDNVNLFNGHLNFSLPLMQIGGRGSAGYTMMLPIEQRWQVQTVAVPTNCGANGCTYSESNYQYIANPIWWTGIRPGFGPGVLQGRQSGSDPFFLEACGGYIYNKTLTRLTFTGPDGTEYELRDQQTNGQPLQGVGCFGGASRGKVFVTADGSATTFISDTSISDDREPQLPQVLLYPSGYLLMRDGTRFRIDNGKTSWIQDTNGNRVSFTYSGDNVVGINDSLNRHITITYGSPTVISFKGANGATRTIKVYSGLLSAALRKYPNGSAEYTIKTFGELFSLQNPQQGNFDIAVTTAVELPDGRQYQFRYDSYANLAQVILPTGGRIEYDWTTGVYQFGQHTYSVVARVLERRTALNTTTTAFETRTTYSHPLNPPSVITVDNLDPKNGNALISRSKHYFHGHWLTNPGGANLYPAWLDGREYQTELFASNGTTVLRRINQTFQQREQLSWWTGSPEGSPPNDPRLVETTTTLVDTNQVSKVTSIDPNNSTGPAGFDQYNNPTKVWEYDFGSGSPGSLLRQTVTTYLNNGYDTVLPSSSNPDISQTYHIRNRPSQISIYDAAGTERARTAYEYDDYVGDDSFHAALVNRSNISGHDSAASTSYIKRGNPTAISNYLLPAGTAITSYVQYDIAGNPVKTIDPRSTTGNVIASTIIYDDNFGGPDNTLAERFSFTELGSQQTFAFPTEVKNALNQSAYSQYDYHLGQAINTQDLNGTISAAYHVDLLDRLTQIRRAFGTGDENQTTVEYDDDDRFIVTKSDLHAFNDNVLVSKQLYDGLGRTIESQQFEGGTNYIAVQTQYDGAGRAFKTSNPFRPWVVPSETAIWTMSAFDSLGRITSVTTPDGSVVSTAYGGNAVTVTDQAGKLRRSISDALGRLTRVDEPNAGNSLGDIATPTQPTAYSYDGLDNLTAVTQGSQQRFFMYDSLKRLIRVRNPEHATLSTLNLSDPITGNSLWSTGYQYDANANVLQKTDPRGVVSTYVYDVLNRVTTVNYSDTTVNPDVSRFYDGAIKGIGRAWYVLAGDNTSVNGDVDKTIIDSYDALGKPLVMRQLFKQNGSWSSNEYRIERQYNRAGGVILQQYPSERSVTYNYDNAGRLADRDASSLAFVGTLGDGTLRTYSRGLSYASGGQLKQEQFGTNTAVFTKRFYNSRQQLAETLVSTTGGDTSWNRGKILNQYSLQCSGVACNATDNNGNLRKQEIFIPGDEQVTTSTSWYQQYDYDELNRLKRVYEYTGVSGLDWQQEYLYDRWGNRTIDDGVTKTFGAGINNKKFEIEITTNRLYADGDSVLADNLRKIRYDAAGNQIKDTYTGYGNATFDAENHITSVQDKDGGVAYYSYNADGRRTRRIISNVETWQIYGFDGELVAEYPADGDDGSPQKEYGYRDGQLLVTAEPVTAAPVNVASAANGATATASSAFSGFAASGAINGDRKGLFVWQNGYWSTASAGFPAWLEVQFNSSKTITEIDVFTVQDNYQAPIEPTESATFSVAGLSGYQVQYWNGSAWTTIPDGNVSANSKVWKKFTFSAITTTKIRVLTSASPDNYSRLTEVEAWTGPSPAPRYNLAHTSMGAVATASNSAGAGYGPAGANNGDRKSLNWTNGGGWNDSGPPFPDWLQIDFGSVKTIDEVDVFTLQDNYAGSSEPTESMTFTLWGLTGYEVQYWTGSAWITISGASVTGNNKIWRKFQFSPIATSKIRVLTNASVDGYSRITEVEAYGPADTGGSGGVHWLVSDHLGTPRMIFDQTGSLATVKRHDYLPFGEELFSQQGLRSPGLGYSGGDGVRQQFTSKERDVETGLDYFLARYYSSTQGRFTSPDPLSASGEQIVPQSWNRYSYVLDNPLKLLDPEGEMWIYHYLDEERKRIGIAWIEGNKIPKDLAAKGYKALNFSDERSKDVSLTDGSVVRLNATSGRPELLHGRQQAGGDGGYVNAGLVRELGRQTAPMPMAVGVFALLSLNGGYMLAASPILLADAAAFSLYAVGEIGKNDAQVMMGTTYQEITKGGSIRNVQTDVTKSEFIKNLQDGGYKMTQEGNATILDNGANKYVIYDVAKSTGGPSAAYSRAGEGQSLKIRLKP